MVQIQIQHLLKLNLPRTAKPEFVMSNSNTTFVKVKCNLAFVIYLPVRYSNTTFVKVKFQLMVVLTSVHFFIQIQHLLKLNARKINLYDFIVLLKVLINKDFSYFLPAITRFEGI